MPTDDLNTEDEQTSETEITLSDVADDTVDVHASETLSENSGDETPSDEPEDMETALLDAARKVVPDSETDADEISLEPKLDKDGKAEAKAEGQESANEAEAEGESDQDAQNTETEAEADDAEITSKELSYMNAKTRRKVKGLQEKAAQVDDLKPHAEAAQSLNSYLHEHDIQNEDFTLLLDIGASLRTGNWQKFLTDVTPYIQYAQQAMGQAISPELQQHVDTGHMTPEVAAKLTQQNVLTAHQSAEAQRKNEQTAQAQKAQQTQQAQHNQQLQAEQNSAAVNDWQAQVSLSDPDFPAKQEAIKDFMQLAVKENGYPRTPSEAVAIAQSAYDRVSKMAISFRPQRPATSKTPSASSSATNGARPEPASLEEAAYAGLNAAHSR